MNPILLATLVVAIVGIVIGLKKKRRFWKHYPETTVEAAVMQVAPALRRRLQRERLR